MKLAKLSLAAMVVAGLASSSFAADTLADAFAKGKVSGELRAWYWDRNTNTTGAVGKGDEGIFNAGLVLGYVTDSFYGFKAAATMQSNFAPFADDAQKNLYADDQYGSGAVLSEAYLAYTMKNTTVQVGRMFMATPLVSGSGSRMIKQSFQGAVVINSDLPQTTLIAGYVNKYQGRIDTLATKTDVGNVGDFTNTADITGTTPRTFDDAYTVVAINKSIPNLTLTGAYAVVNEVAGAADADIYNVEANYLLPMSSFKLGFDAVYRASKTGTALDSLNLEGNYMGGRLSVKELAGFGASFAYGQSDSSDGLIAGMGGGADNLYTGTVIRGGTNTYKADTDSYLFAATYDFSKVGVAGLTALAQYAVSEQSRVGAATTSTDYTTIHASVAYAIPSIKGLSVALQYETQEAETLTYATGVKAAVDTDELRFMANYKF